jgi:hypothetical protein
MDYSSKLCSHEIPSWHNVVSSFFPLIAYGTDIIVSCIEDKFCFEFVLTVIKQIKNGVKIAQMSIKCFICIFGIMIVKGGKENLRVMMFSENNGGKFGLGRYFECVFNVLGVKYLFGIMLQLLHEEIVDKKWNYFIFCS